MFSPLATLLVATPAPALCTPAPMAQEELMTMWMADGRTLLKHPKDQALAAAMALIEARLQELPGEIPDAQYPPQIVPWITGLLAGQKSLRIARDDASAPIPLALQLDWKHDSPEAATKISGDIAGFLRQMGAPLGEPDTDGWIPIPAEMPLPMGFGPRGDRLSLTMGKPFGGPTSTAAPDLPDGVQPDMLMNMDVGATLELVLEMMTMAAPEEAAMLDDLSSVLGLDELSMQYACGADAERGYGVMRMPDFGAAMKRRGLVDERGLDAAHLRAVPVDAMWANVSRVNLQAMLDLVLALLDEPLSQEGIEDPIEMVAQMTGIHIERDLLDHLGMTLGLYASDTTGGGGLASTVMFVEVANAEGLRPFLERMKGMIDGVGQAEMEGYMQVRGWERKGLPHWTLTFPGMPIPVEVSMALTDSLLIVGMTPGALHAAVDQAMGAPKSLLDHPGFVDQLPSEPIGSFAVGFMDTPRLLRDGYGTMSMMTSALVNGTRSRRDASRDAGIVMPSYHELMDGAKPLVQIGRVEGDDYVAHSRSDASFVVNATGILGYYMANPAMLMGVIASVGMQSYQQAQYQDWPVLEATDYENR